VLAAAVAVSAGCRCNWLRDRQNADDWPQFLSVHFNSPTLPGPSIPLRPSVITLPTTSQGACTIKSPPYQTHAAALWGDREYNPSRNWFVWLQCIEMYSNADLPPPVPPEKWHDAPMVQDPGTISWRYRNINISYYYYCYCYDSDSPVSTNNLISPEHIAL